MCLFTDGCNNIVDFAAFYRQISLDDIGIESIHRAVHPSTVLLVLLFFCPTGLSLFPLTFSLDAYAFMVSMSLKL
ncbi:hypothetical protein AB1N83_007866 [Pleurotus pulmonarius]